VLAVLVGVLIFVTDDSRQTMKGGKATSRENVQSVPKTHSNSITATTTIGGTDVVFSISPCSEQDSTCFGSGRSNAETINGITVYDVVSKECPSFGVIDQRNSRYYNVIARWKNNCSDNLQADVRTEIKNHFQNWIGVSKLTTNESTQTQKSDPCQTAINSTSHIGGTAFDPMTIHCGDTVGVFTVVRAYPAISKEPFADLLVDFVGTTTVVGVLSTDIGLTGPSIGEIAPGTAARLPHPAYEQAPTYFEIRSPSPALIPGADHVHDGDTVEAIISTWSVEHAPKDGSPYGAKVISIRQLKPAQISYPKITPALPGLSVVIPAGWIVDATSTDSFAAHSPDYATADTLADYTGYPAAIISGQRVIVHYQKHAISGSLDAKGYIDWWKSVQNPCESCQFEEMTVGIPALLITATKNWGAHMTLSADNHGNDFSMTIDSASGDHKEFLSALLGSVRFTD